MSILVVLESQADGLKRTSCEAITAAVDVAGGAAVTGIIFNGSQERGHLVHLVMGKDQIRVLAHPKKGETVQLVKQEGSLATDAWHRVKMSFSGETLKATIDDRDTQSGVARSQ